MVIPYHLMHVQLRIPVLPFDSPECIAKAIP